MRTSKIFAAALTTASLLSAGSTVSQAQETSDETIVEVAQAAGSFETLLGAAAAANLVETLRSEGPFTIFAPNDEAFARIPEAQLEALLQDEQALQAVLLYHVIPGRVVAADVATLRSAETVSGRSVSVTVAGGVVKVGGATVVATDIEASNGVIHVIDRVLLPQS